MKMPIPLDDNQSWNELLLGEVLLYSLLGKLIYTLPEKTWLDSLYQEDVFSESPFAMNQPEVVRGLQLLKQWGNQPDGLSEASLQDLNADYTRLFVGVGSVLAPLWESVYFSEERLVFQERTLQVRAWYRQFGLEPENLHREPDDHIGLEMAFLAHVARLGLGALEREDQAAFADSLVAQRRFLQEHLLQWGPAWTQDVEKHARTDFYRGIALLTRGAISELASILGLNLPVELAK